MSAPSSATDDVTALLVGATDASCERLPDDTDCDLLRDFIAECTVCIVASEVALGQLEVNPRDEEALGRVFRALHTIKGTAGCLGLGRLSSCAHEAESLLCRVRAREIAYSQRCATLALQAVDMLNALVAIVGVAVDGDGQLPLPSHYVEVLSALAHFDETTDVSERNVTPVPGTTPSSATRPRSTMRMVPLTTVFARLARVVRDTAVKTGKTVQFITEGDDVAIDRDLMDVLTDPLLHMVRNAVDHGIEPPAERARIGKAATGIVRISAHSASGNVVIELSDDGRGLHRDTLIAKAVEKRLIDSDRGMSDADVFSLIFAPGFSTAHTLTEISGRGVGMDIVRRNLESAHGRIDIASIAGRGSTFAIRLPLAQTSMRSTLRMG